MNWASWITGGPEWQATPWQWRLLMSAVFCISATTCVRAARDLYKALRK